MSLRKGCYSIILFNLKILFSLLLWNVLSNKFISDFRHIVIFVFYFFIINVRDLDLLERCSLNGLIICHSFGDRDSDSHAGCVLLFVISLIRYVGESDYWFIIDVVLLNWYFFDFDIGLWFILGHNSFNSFRTM